MTAQLYEEVVLNRDLPAEGLKPGDLGTVVHVYQGGFEVEFFTAAGKTRSVVTLAAEDVRAVTEDEMVAVRPLSATG